MLGSDELPSEHAVETAILSQGDSNPEITSINADLKRLAELWPNLTTQIRQAILALAQAKRATWKNGGR